jgi:hypothetical protein
MRAQRRAFGAAREGPPITSEGTLIWLIWSGPSQLPCSSLAAAGQLRAEPELVDAWRICED